MPFKLVGYISFIYIADALQSLGIVNGRVKMCQRDDLVDDHIGGTERKTAEIAKSVRGGTLIIDEVYNLARGSKMDYGADVVSTLMRYMKTPGSEGTGPEVMIFIGYKELMDRFLSMNRGLQRRITNTVNMPNMTNDQIIKIACKVLRDMGISTRMINEAECVATLSKVDDQYIANHNASMGRCIAEQVAQVQQRHLMLLPHLQRLKEAKTLRQEQFIVAIEELV